MPNERPTHQDAELLSRVQLLMQGAGVPIRDMRIEVGSLRLLRIGFRVGPGGFVTKSHSGEYSMGGVPVKWNMSLPEHWLVLLQNGVDYGRLLGAVDLRYP